MTRAQKTNPHTPVFRAVKSELELLTINNITTTEQLKASLYKYMDEGHSETVAGALTCRDVIPVTRSKLFLIEVLLTKFIKFSNTEEDKAFIERIIDEQRLTLKDVQE